MWWEEDSWVPERISVLSAARRDRQLPAVTAVGSTWTEKGERTLFVGVHPARDPRPWAWAPGEGVRARLTRLVIRRYGPLPYPEQVSPEYEPTPVDEERDLDLIVRTRTPAAVSMTRVLRVLAGLRQQEIEARMRLLVLSLAEADSQTQKELMRFELPVETRIGYVGPIQPRAKKGSAVFRRRPTKQGTVGSVVETPLGPLLTTAGHLGAEAGDLVYRRRSRFSFADRPWGRVAVTTCPESPDRIPTAAGVDVAAIFPHLGSINGTWTPVEPGDPRRLRRGDYVCWNGGMTGSHTGSVSILARHAEAMDGVDYGHVVMVLGDPPGYGGASGDSGTAIYDGEGRLLGYFVGTEGGRSPRGVAPAAWFQMIDAVQPYLEDRCGSITGYLGDGLV